MLTPIMAFAPSSAAFTFKLSVTSLHSSFIDSLYAPELPPNKSEKEAVRSVKNPVPAT